MSSCSGAGFPTIARPPGISALWCSAGVSIGSSTSCSSPSGSRWNTSAFAGPDPERARYYPEDKGFLLEFEPTVTHYEVYPPPAQGAP